jgi:inorganic triphosphatase YgiF
MTIPGDKNVIVGEDLTPEGKKKLHTDDIAGTAKPDSEKFKKIGRDKDTGGNGTDADLEPLFAGDVERDFRTRWRDIQSGFVDEPRPAVEKADQLVAELMQRLAQSFSEQRKNLENQWEASEKISTEELRVALTRYRSFFERLLSV